MAKNYAQVHRYYDCVALHVGSGSTVYMPLEEARKLANVLICCAEDIRKNKFSASEFVTVEFALTDTGHNGISHVQERD